MSEFLVEVNGVPYSIQLQGDTNDPRAAEARVNGRTYLVRYPEQGGEEDLGVALVLQRRRPPRPLVEDADDSVELLSPMPGQILRIVAEVGEEVEAGAALVVLEAMKMESTLPAPVAGRVVEHVVQEGDRVASHQPLVRLRSLS